MFIDLCTLSSSILHVKKTYYYYYPASVSVHPSD